MLKIIFISEIREPLWMADKSFSIGRSNDNDWVIHSPEVPLHCLRLTLIDQSYQLHNLFEQFPIYVNGQEVDSYTLQDGDKIQIGTLLVEVRSPFIAGNQKDWVLVGTTGWLTGRVFPVKSVLGAQSIIGRSDHCDIALSGTHIPKKHAMLTTGIDGLRLQNLSKTTGIFVNDVWTDETNVFSGDSLRLDIYNFVVFGPHSRPCHQELPNTDDLTQASPQTLSTSTAEIKQWKTRPTSPGNRIEPPPPPDKALATFKIIASLLFLATLFLLIYLVSG